MTRLQEHLDAIDRAKQEGMPILSYTAPCCGAKMETTAPRSADHWDSLVTCPHCGLLFGKVVTPRRVRVTYPEGGWQ